MAIQKKQLNGRTIFAIVGTDKWATTEAKARRIEARLGKGVVGARAAAARKHDKAFNTQLLDKKANKRRQDAFVRAVEPLRDSWFVIRDENFRVYVIKARSASHADELARKKHRIPDNVGIDVDGPFKTKNDAEGFAEDALG